MKDKGDKTMPITNPVALLFWRGPQEAQRCPLSFLGESICVLDRSWLQAAPAEELLRLAERYVIVVAADLFFEIGTAAGELWARMNRKLAPVAHQLWLGEQIWAVLHDEKKTQAPSERFIRPVSTMAFRYYLEHSGGKVEHFMREIVERSRAYRETDRLPGFKSILRHMARSFDDWGSVIEGAKQSDLESPFKSLVQTRGNVLQAIRSLRGSDFGEVVGSMDNTWTTYIWMQFLMVSSLEYRRRYGTQEAAASEARLSNWLHDLSYGVLAAQAGCLATADEDLSLFFRSVCPNGRLVELGH